MDFVLFRWIETRVQAITSADSGVKPVRPIQLIVTYGGAISQDFQTGERLGVSGKFGTLNFHPLG